MKAWLRKHFPIDRPSPRSPLRQVVDHLAGVLLIVAMWWVTRAGW